MMRRVKAWYYAAAGAVMCAVLIAGMYGRIAVWGLSRDILRPVALGVLLMKNGIGKGELPEGFSYLGRRDDVNCEGAEDAAGQRYYLVAVISRNEATGRTIGSEFVFNGKGTCVLWRGNAYELGRADWYDFTGDGTIEKVIAYEMASGRGEGMDMMLEIWQLRGDGARLLFQAAYARAPLVAPGERIHIWPQIVYAGSHAQHVALYKEEFEEMVQFVWSGEELKFVASPGQGEYWQVLAPNKTSEKNHISR